MLWLVVIVAMAISDALTGDWSPELQVAMWMLMFFVGSIGTVMVLAKDANVALGLPLLMSGYFLSAYNATWATFAIASGNYSFGGPVFLYPFFVSVEAWVFYLMIAAGLALTGLGLILTGIWKPKQSKRHILSA